MDIDGQGVESVDSPATSVDGGTTPAQAPVTPAAPPQLPFHQHPRFRELTSENRELKASVNQLTQRLQQLEQRAQSGGVTSDEQRQYSEAAGALKKIFAADPDLKAWYDSRLHLPQLSQGYQQLSNAQANAQRDSARGHIAQLASKEGMPADPKWLSHLTRLVAGAAMGLPEGNERYDRGDFTVLDEAFESVKTDFFASLNKAASASLQSTKTKTSKLPPAPRGGVVGEEAPKPIEPGKEREYIQGLHKRGLAMLKERMTG